MVEQERAKVHLRVVRFVAKVILGPSHSVVLCTLVYNFSFRRPLHACLQLQAAPQSVTVREKKRTRTRPRPGRAGLGATGHRRAVGAAGPDAAAVAAATALGQPARPGLGTADAAFAPGAAPAGAGVVGRVGAGPGGADVARVLPAPEPRRADRPAGPLPPVVAATQRASAAPAALGDAGDRLGRGLRRGAGSGRRPVPVPAGGARPGQRAAAPVAAAGRCDSAGGGRGVGVAVRHARAAAGTEKR